VFLRGLRFLGPRNQLFEFAPGGGADVMVIEQSDRLDVSLYVASKE
jgi:hypothetical protein